jgi:heterodisulfide reductase subunit A-like polyferredoxin/predicted peroxiredoxin
MKSNDLKGAVMVIGGGIGGIQASLDLANAGFKVYLVEKSFSIGGTMARLDKTFPTNDCAMCILSPKLVECGRHLNIEILSNAEVESIQGSPGHFTVSVRKKSRFVDVSRCTGCGDCAQVCPILVSNEFEGGLAKRKAIYRPFPQAFPSAFGIQKKGVPNCQAACPLEQKAEGYVALIREGRFREAMQVVRMDNPFPGICGRACHHPCMEACQRGLLDEAIGIPYLKRFLADYEVEQGFDTLPRRAEEKGIKVAVVGGGPSGLSCAYFLRLLGYQVTIFEAQDRLGGMMTLGIPAYRLPREVVEREIALVESLGVEVVLQKRWGKDFTLEDLFKEGFQAVYLACGAWKGMKAGVEGEDHPRVMDGLSYLTRVNKGEAVPEAETVVVIGGGNVAIDCARSALRKGVRKVAIYYRRAREEMPAREEEIEEAQEEGVEFYFCAAPKRFVEKNGKLVMETHVMRLCAPDESGRRRPEVIPGMEYDVEADLFIIAIGQKIDLPEKDLGCTRWGTVAVDENLETVKKGVFAGGDLVLGPATLVEAIAHGKRAAFSIDRYFSGKENQEIQRFPAPLSVPWQEARKPRVPLRKFSVTERLKGFLEVSQGYTVEEAQKEAQRCLSCGECSECMRCVEVCQRRAIQHDQQDETQTIEVGAVVVATGAEVFDPTTAYRELGYRKYPNVVTSLDFERILNASGPFQGKVVRPSDQKVPRKIAFVQCVGSRDEERGKPYCSSVCCMYAIKEALVAREHLAVEKKAEQVACVTCGSTCEPSPESSFEDGEEPLLDVTVFAIDVRAYGKDFERYYERAKSEGIRFIKGKVGGIRELENRDLEVTYVNERGKVEKEVFDLVVLSVGLAVPEKEQEKLAELGLPLAPWGLLYTDALVPIRSFREGIFFCGTVAAPKDIPDTVQEASACACEVASFLHPARFTEVREKEYPIERDVSTEPVRIGVFVCRCGINIAGVVDVQKVAEWARKFPGVVYVEENLYTCSQDTQERIKEKIREYGLNRVIVASCSPRTHEGLFRETLREAGLNPYLFEMANIRDQCSWVHREWPEEATEKAKDLVAMAVAKASLLEPLKPTLLPLEKSVLVIGGGLSGMVAAWEAAEQGLKVYLVEREKELGGQLRGFERRFTAEGVDLVQFARSLLRKIMTHPQIEVLTGSRVLSSSGFVGNFETVVVQDGSERTIKHGGVIIATGAREYRPWEFLYGMDHRVITQVELERILQNPVSFSPRKVVMIQCVGSRNAEHPYCSRVCCITAVKNALRVKDLYPEAEVFILYRDIRTYGLTERFYREARRRGVVFIPFRDDEPPEVSSRGEALLVQVRSALLDGEITIPADWVVLSAGIEAEKENRDIAQLFKVPLNQDGFFLEAHVKLRPVDFATEGVFVCGLAHGPKLAQESILQAKACVSRLMTILSKDTIHAEAQIATVEESRCTACGDCERVCQYRAIRVNSERNVAEVNPALCKGCGLCSATCKSGAIRVQGFAPEQIISEVEYLPW